MQRKIKRVSLLVFGVLAAISCLPRSSFGSFPSYDDLYVPDRISDAPMMRIRPDSLRVAFAARAETLVGLRAAVDVLTDALVKVAPGAVIQMHGLSLEHVEEKAYIETDGDITFALSADSGFWTRSELVTRLHAAGEAVVLRQSRGTVRLSVEEPVAEVADPEQHRNALLALHAGRVAAFVQAAMSRSGSLRFLNCQPAGAVQQERVSFESVQLSLPFDCRIEIEGS